MLALPLPECSHSDWQVYSFSDIRDYFLQILTYTEDQVKHPDIIWTK